MTILRTAHGNAAAHGAVLVAETPPLDELPRPNAARTAEGVAASKVRGRPFQKGNKTASGRGPSLTMIMAAEPDAPAERVRVLRKARSLKAQCERELRAQFGGMPLPANVKVEIVHWARASAYAESADRRGDQDKAVFFAEKAAGHNLKAVGLAERAAASRSTQGADPFAAWRSPDDSKQ